MPGLFDSFDLGPIAEKTQPTQKSQKASKRVVVDPSQPGDLLQNEEFKISIKKPKVNDLLTKLAMGECTEVDTQKLLKSKKVTLQEKLAIIRDKVLAILGKQQKNVIVIKTKEEFEDYVSKAIEFGRVAVDTETNNSTDPMTCQLMGLCLYYEGGKQAYIPINHVDPDTGIRLPWQLTEQDCKEQLQRFKDAGTFIVMHNGKFDYEVIKCTCDIELAPDWDTMIGAHTIDENELMGLKPQYISKIDPSQAKYDIEHLFTVPYKYVDPAIFALYAATDSMMTDKLYLYQLPILTAAGNERLYWLFLNIEMPIVQVTAEIELAGVCIDQEFGERLKVKYDGILETIDKKIDAELEALKDRIDAWKQTKEATERARQYQPKKSKKSLKQIEDDFPYVDDKTGKRYKIGKAKADQLDEKINLASPVQLAILFYDILKLPAVSKKSPRGTGKEEMEALAEKTDSALCKLLVERRGIAKLISTYIDVIPALAKHWPDGRVRYRLNSVGTDTGRFSSGGEFKFLDEEENRVEMASINSQNIPSRGDGKITRMLFKAKEEFGSVEIDNNCYQLPEITEIETVGGWKFGKDLVVGDRLVTDEGEDTIIDIVYIDKQYLIYV